MASGSDRVPRVSVFLSHATEGDGSLCAQFAKELERHGIDPWYAHGDRGIAIGQDWLQRLLSEIDRCDVLVVLASKHIHGSAYCSLETRHAKGKRKHVLLVRVDDYPLPPWAEFLAGDRQHLSLHRASLQEVARGLAQLCHDAVAGHLNPGEDMSETVDLRFEVAARGHVHPVSIPRGGTTAVVGVAIPPCGQNQVVRKDLGGDSTLTLYVRVLPSPEFRLMPDGKDVLVSVQVEADRIGDCERLSVPTLDGIRQVAVPAASRQPGGRVRLKGLGIGMRGARSAGDLVVELVAIGSPPGRAPEDEWMALHQRLGGIMGILVFAVPVMMVLGISLGSFGAGAVPLAIGVLGYVTIGAWLGSLAVAQRHRNFADWLPALAAVLCFVPAIGPWGLPWCAKDLDLGHRADAVRKALLSHAIPASGAGILWVSAPGWGWPGWAWRVLTCVAIAGAATGLVRAWRAMVSKVGGG